MNSAKLDQNIADQKTRDAARHDNGMLTNPSKIMQARDLLNEAWSKVMSARRLISKGDEEYAHPEWHNLAEQIADDLEGLEKQL